MLHYIKSFCVDCLNFSFSVVSSCREFSMALPFVAVKLKSYKSLKVDKADRKDTFFQKTLDLIQNQGCYSEKKKNIYNSLFWSVSKFSSWQKDIDPTQTLFSGVHLNKGKVPAVKSYMGGFLTTRLTCSFSFPLILFRTNGPVSTKSQPSTSGDSIARCKKNSAERQNMQSHLQWQKRVLSVQVSWSVSNWKKKTWQQLFWYFMWPVF